MKSGKPVDYTRTVPVKVKATRKDGSEYWTTVYKRPYEVEHDDKVIGNYHLLSEHHPQYKPKKSSNSPIPYKVEHQVDKFYNSLHENQTIFFKFLNHNGITWKTNKSPIKNLNSAKRALMEAIHLNNFNLDNPPVTIEHILTKPAQIDTESMEAAKTIAHEYYHSINKNKELLFKQCDEWGIPYPKDTPNEVIRCIKALENLKKVIALHGFDPYHPVPLRDTSLLKPSPNSSEREKTLITYINNLTDIDVINVCTHMGVVPEDDRAKEFITDSFHSNFMDDILNAPPDVRLQISKQWGKAILNNLITAQHSISHPTPEGFGKLISDKLSFDGCKRNILQEGFNTLATSFNMSIITNPRSTISTVTQNGSQGEHGGIQIANIIQHLNEGYSLHTTDSYSEYQSNLGYSGYDPDVYKERYSIDKGQSDGFIRYLDKIQSDNPSESISNIVDSMK